MGESMTEIAVSVSTVNNENEPRERKKIGDDTQIFHLLHPSSTLPYLRQGTVPKVNETSPALVLMALARHVPSIPIIIRPLIIDIHGGVSNS
jgi:hypothetical protein